MVVLMLILPLYNNSRLTLRKEYGGSPDDGHSLHLWICKAGSMNFVSQPPHGGSFTLVCIERVTNAYESSTFLHDIKTANELSASVTCLMQAYSLLHI